jgi:hypothetical protein
MMLVMVRKERLELSRLAALEPKSSASTNSATFAWFWGNARNKAVHYSPSSTTLKARTAYEFDLLHKFAVASN